MFFFFFNDTATTEIYTLSLHDALPICWSNWVDNTAVGNPAQFIVGYAVCDRQRDAGSYAYRTGLLPSRSEEHTSELQSRQYLVCRLLLEKKKQKPYIHTDTVPRHPSIP